ncbi:hypothetical protein DJ73_06275 [Halorubrum sp. Ea1]|uniref:acyltransferase n=1 Tax=Halorubrum sp. Ea1 TaxID=1480718 RepID=UPI000B99B0FB|nr:acyltransferase [Halorubrum sp. Ea1]OYR53902.1 hypothetical protein DJ73_06275 [Halorubrum sp. Ea1]
MIRHFVNNDFLKKLAIKVRKPFLMLLYPDKYSSDAYVRYLRVQGVKIGENTEFYSPETSHIDVTRPSLVEIGDNVKMTRGTTVLTHDYAWSVLRNKYGGIFGSAGKVKIGDNVFIGNNTTILKNVEIGDNVIISSNSLVNDDVPSDCVVGGVPARKLLNLDEFYEKRRSEYVAEAKHYAESIKQRFDRDPILSDFEEFFPVFLEREEENLTPEFRRRITDNGNLPASEIELFLDSEPEYESFEDFLDDCDI